MKFGIEPHLEELYFDSKFNRIVAKRGIVYLDIQIGSDVDCAELIKALLFHCKPSVTLPEGITPACYATDIIFEAKPILENK